MQRKKVHSKGEEKVIDWNLTLDEAILIKSSSYKGHSSNSHQSFIIKS